MIFLRAIIFIVLFSSSGIAFKTDEKLQNQTDELRAEKLFYEIRCVVCEGESLAESNADLAVDLRKLIRAKISAGQNEEEIKTFLVGIYGKNILQNPPIETSTYLLWILPLVVIISGISIIFRNIKNDRRS